MADKNQNPIDELERYVREHGTSEEEISEAFKIAGEQVRQELADTHRRWIFNQLYEPNRLYTLFNGKERKSYVTDWTNRIRGYPYLAYICDVCCYETYSDSFNGPTIFPIPVSHRVSILDSEEKTNKKSLSPNSGLVVVDFKNLTKEQGTELRDQQTCFVYLFWTKKSNLFRNQLTVCATNYENYVYHGNFYVSRFSSGNSCETHPYPKGTKDMSITTRPSKIDDETINFGCGKVLDVKTIRYGQLFPILIQSKEPGSLEKRLINFF